MDYDAPTVRRMVEKLEPYEFDGIYGPGGTGKIAVRRSAARHVRALEDS